jgi:uncharacterized protein with NAD-binding domain and iron-sulfur cluster
MAKTRIAILGGGAGALTAAFHLTRTPHLRAQYDVTIYQLGWRLGGQGASGRNRARNDRIEEHGLHIWMGWYENAFAMMHETYAEQVKDRTNPFTSWTDAFKPHSFTPIGLGDGRTFFHLEWPENSDRPGDGHVLLSPMGAITEAIGILAEMFGGLFNALLPASGPLRWILKVPVLAIQAVFLMIEHSRPSRALGRLLRKSFALLESAWRFVRSPFGKGGRRSVGGALVHGLEIVLAYAALGVIVTVKAVVGVFARKGGLAELAGRVLDTAAAMTRGMLNPKYGLTDDWNLNRIDDYELLDWLIENGARETIKSVPGLKDAPELRALYDLAFAYRPSGDAGLMPDFAAGTAIRALIRIFATYKGAVFYEMQAGMGETVIAPIYQVLRQRGVAVRFFSKVKRLELSENGKWVQRIHISRQVDTPAAYEPLFAVNGLPCWPTEPFWDQVKDGEAIRQRLDADGQTLESHWCSQEVGTDVLELGTHFDKVILGINLGAFQHLNDEDGSLCDELIEADPAFRAMTERLGLIPTFGVQLWMDRDLRGLGWTAPSPAMDGAVEPMDVWADMSHFLARERWPIATAPRSLQFFCGPWNTDLFRRPASHRSTPADALAAVRGIAQGWLERNTDTIWPAALRAAGGSALDWALLHDRAGRTGPERLDDQWIRPNVDPTECCVASWHGSTAYRLAPGRSGFQNLYLAGTWTRTGMNATCVEGAVMSGMAASRAICGEPRHIVGDDFFQSPSEQK